MAHWPQTAWRRNGLLGTIMWTYCGMYGVNAVIPTKPLVYAQQVLTPSALEPDSNYLLSSWTFPDSEKKRASLDEAIDRYNAQGHIDYDKKLIAARRLQIADQYVYERDLQRIVEHAYNKVVIPQLQWSLSKPVCNTGTVRNYLLFGFAYLLAYANRLRHNDSRTLGGK